MSHPHPSAQPGIDSRPRTEDRAHTVDHSVRLIGLVPPVVIDALRAANAHDVERFVDCFDVDAVIDAWGMLFEGSSGIALWTERWVVDYRVRFTDLLHAWEGHSVLVHTQVHGVGYNGPATFTFSLREETIHALSITR